MDIVTIDFETYYDKDFSLSKMTTESYIRDPRFEVIGVGVKVNDHQTDFYSGDNPGKFLKSLDYSKRAILCHNTAFDGFILSHHFGIRPRFWLDTLSMARPKHSVTVGGSLKALTDYYHLGSKGDEVVHALGKRRADFTPDEMARYASYCCNDVEITYKLFMELRRGFPASELRIIDQTLRMFTEPQLVLNKPLLKKHLENVINKKASLVEALGLECTEEEAKKMLMSNEKFAGYLIDCGVTPPQKQSPSTGKLTFAFSKTDRGFTDLLEHHDERVQAAVAARLGVKSTLEETRTRSLIGVAERGPLPIMLNYYGAHTGRFSGGDKMNLQNLPRGGALRKSLCAPEGKMLIACDSAQIEARVVAWVAQQNDLLDAFREKRDVYSEFASEVYGRKVTKADKIERFVGKTCIAEGTLILTERGEIPIEEITLEDRVWDGIEWVSHDGLIYQGEKDVITYQGVTATEDHGVFTEYGPLPFGIAASRLATLITSGHGGEPVRISKDYLPANTTPEQAHLLVSKMYEVWRRKMDTRRQFDARGIQRMPALFADQITTLKGIGEKIRRYLCSLLHPNESGLQTLRRAWHTFEVCIPHGIYPMDGEELTTQELSRCGDRPHRQRRALRTGESSIGYSKGASSEQTQYSKDKVERANSSINGVPIPVHTIVDVQVSRQEWYDRRSYTKKVRVYDIMNAGPRRRFTANGVLVFNCVLGLGYGMGADKFKATLAIGQAGLRVNIDYSEAKRIVNLYRTKNHKIATFWNRCNTALSHLVSKQDFALVSHSPHVELIDDGIRLPNGLAIRYSLLTANSNGYVYTADARVYREAVKDRVLGQDLNTDKFIHIYGVKVTENLVQALARIVVAEQMIKIGERYKVVLQVHDEVVILCDAAEVEEAKAYMLEVMSTPPAWAPDLPVACEADHGENYGECK